MWKSCCGCARVLQYLNSRRLLPTRQAFSQTPNSKIDQQYCFSFQHWKTRHSIKCLRLPFTRCGTRWKVSSSLFAEELLIRVAGSSRKTFSLSARKITFKWRWIVTEKLRRASGYSVLLRRLNWMQTHECYVTVSPSHQG